MTGIRNGLRPYGTRRGAARTGAALLVLAAALVLLVRPPSVARAEKPPNPNLLERVEQIEAQLDALTAALAAETRAREAAEAALQNALDAESVARADGDAGLQRAVDAAQETLAPFSTAADGAGGYDVYVTGANLHIENGLGSTNTTNGLGNLIVGYNELGDLTEEDRTGSHNLVVGPKHGYVSYGGLIAGYRNYVSGHYSSVSGGTGNTASSGFSSVSGGEANTASGPFSSVSGGDYNTANNWWSSVSGGHQNTASGGASSVSGGKQNIASGPISSVSGGWSRVASGYRDWVAGSLWEDQ